MVDDTNTSQESSTLSEWQQRHQEYEETKTREEKSEQSKNIKKKPKKRALKREVKKQAKLKSIQQNSERRQESKRLGLSYLFLSLIVLVLSFYFITPLSSTKRITIDGLKNESVEQLISVSGIEDNDYIISLLLHQNSFEKNMVNGSDWIASASIAYSFPNEFAIKVKENEVAGYTQTDNGYEPILESGVQIHQQASELPDTFTVINVNKESNHKRLIAELKEVDQSIVDNIHIITLVGSKSSKDLVQIEMYDGNVVLIPISDISEKLNYYTIVATRVASPTTIDMEVGIYTHANESQSTSEVENQDSNLSEAGVDTEFETNTEGE